MAILYVGSMNRVQIAQLRNQVSHYVQRAARGETIVILNRSRSVAVLAPYIQPHHRTDRLLGCMEGSARVRADIIRSKIPPGDWFRS